MDPLNNKPDINQVQRLEEIAKYSMAALELCAAMGDYQTSLTKFKNRKDIFERAVQGLRQMIPISLYAFYSVDAHDFDIELEHCDSPKKQIYIKGVVDFLIEKNIVARAFREKRTLTARTPDHKHHLLIHALTTTSRSYGVFFCFLEKIPLEMRIVDKITTIVMKATCYALENFDLYRLLDQKNAELTEKNIRLSESEIIYRNTFENTGNPTVVVNSEGIITYTNSQFLSFSGWDRSHLVNKKKITDFIVQSGKIDFPLLLLESEKEIMANPNEYIFENGATDRKDVFLKISSLGIDSQYIIAIMDVTRIKEAEKELLHHALHDHLTSLPNRMLLQDRLSQAVKKKKRNEQSDYAVFFIDLDRFKSINDTLGHAVGDLLLIQTAKRIQSSLRDVDTVARFGGDEFVILLEGVRDKKVCEVLSQRILKNFSSPINIADQELFISMSIGILLSSMHNVEEADVIRLADMSMYEAKKRGRNKVVYSHEIEDKKIEKKLYLENHLLKGIQADEFFIQYQPMIRLTTNKLFGVEALARWQHPDLGIIAPNTFIPIAEESGLIIPLGRKIIELAFTDYACWMDRFPDLKNFQLCLNLSIKQMLHADIVDDIKNSAGLLNVPLQNVCLEITESLFIDDTKQVANTIHKLKKIGVSIAIDDFGTGYSSLKYLNQFSIDMVKIDRLLIHDITENTTNFKIVSSMLQLCETMDLNVMAEGIENTIQLEKLIQMKCQLGQGYHFAPPQDKSVIEQLIATTHNNIPRP